MPNVDTWVGNFDNAPYADREIFNMDNVGNRTSVTNGTITNYTTNNLNQYTQVNGTNLTYDLNGNMTNDGYNQITYDYTNRPVKFNNTDYVVEIRYDALRRRIEKKVTKKADSTTEIEGYALDGVRVISDNAGDGFPKKQYIWGNRIDELLVTAKGRSREYDFYLNNSLGSITHIANKKSEVQESYKYKVYGSVTIYDKKGDVIQKSKEKNRYMFTGREYEPEIKLYYYRARDYSANMGRFISRDPKTGYPFGYKNLYAYAANNSVIIIDPWGTNDIHMDVSCAASIVHQIRIVPESGTSLITPVSCTSYDADGIYFGPHYGSTVLKITDNCWANISCDSKTGDITINGGCWPWWLGGWSWFTCATTPFGIPCPPGW